MITSAAPRAGAQQICAQTMPAGFTPILRRELLYALRKARGLLGLTPRDISVLDALLSFLPCRDRKTGRDLPVTPDMMLVVYASNTTICERANGMSDRNLRRYVDRLAQAGLLARRDSATGKRFPLRRGGKVVDAYGLDLGPLFRSAERIALLAAQAEAEAEEARSLRAEALTLRANLLRDANEMSTEDRGFVDMAKTLLRRVSLGLEGIRAILERLHSLWSTLTGAPDVIAAPCPTHVEHVPDITLPIDCETSSTEEMSDGNGQTVRQVETPKTDTKKRKTAEASLGAIWDQCPTLTAFLPRQPTCMEDARDIIRQFARLIGLTERSFANGLRRAPLGQVLQALEHIASRPDCLNDPDLQFHQLLGKRKLVQALCF